MTPDTVSTLFLSFSASKLRELTQRIETCFGLLTEEQVWIRGGESQNSVGNLVLHLCGNVRQWIISGAGGQPDTRDRDSEFAARGGASIAELQDRLRETANEAAATLSSLRHERLAERLTIQGYEVSVLDAIYHAVEHYSMHTGQIILLTKIFTGSDLGFYTGLSGRDR